MIESLVYARLRNVTAIVYYTLCYSINVSSLKKKQTIPIFICDNCTRYYKN